MRKYVNLLYLSKDRLGEWEKLRSCIGEERSDRWIDG